MAADERIQVTEELGRIRRSVRKITLGVLGEMVWKCHLGFTAAEETRLRSAYPSWPSAGYLSRSFVGDDPRPPQPTHLASLPL